MAYDKDILTPKYAITAVSISTLSDTEYFLYHVSLS